MRSIHRDGWTLTAYESGGPYDGTEGELYNVVEDPVHVHDFHATMLHCLGIDHKKLTYKFQGRDFRLTDVSGEVVKALLA